MPFPFIQITMQKGFYIPANSYLSNWLYGRKEGLWSEISFGCEIMTFGHCEIFRLRGKWNEINPLTRRSAFHMPQAYFTCVANFTNPARDLFRWKETTFVLVDKGCFFSGADGRTRTGMNKSADFKSAVSANSTTSAYGNYTVTRLKRQGGTEGCSARGCRKSG